MNEDWDDMAAAEPLAGEELERVLARYARVRLDPSQAQARRARAVVMEEAWRRRIAATRTASPAHRGLFGGWSARRLGVSLVAATLAGLMLGTSVFAASRAGGPLYETRLALEELTLPADAAGRIDAQLTAAQTRLAEAVEASGRHDDGATVAALDAYDRIIDELMGASGPAATRALVAIQVHHDVLLRVAGNVPAAAANGIERALANSERVIERLSSTVAGNGNGNGNGSGTPGMGGGKPVETGEPTAKPGKPADPRATPKPDKTPKPRPTPSPRGKSDGNRPPAPTKPAP